MITGAAKTVAKAEHLFRTGGRIPSLDGLRAVSIGLVVFAHLCGCRYFVSLVPPRHALGNLGVRVFFVISGFLITSLLLQEFSQRGRVSQKIVYLRRTLRIRPSADVYIGLILLLNFMGFLALPANDLLHAATYTMNYQHVRSWQLTHLWSLSVEEQFYLIWPLVMILLGPRRGIWAAAATLLLTPLVRVGTWYLTPEMRWGIGGTFQTNADALAVGCVLAGMRTWLWARPAYLSFQQSHAFLVVPAVALVGVFLNAFEEGPMLLISYAVGTSALNLAIALIIDRSVRLPGDWMGQFLNWKPMVFIGTLSYSLYLWQEPFLNRLSTSPISAFPVNLVLTFAVALASYYLVEKPFLGLRRRIERRIQPKPELVTTELAYNGKRAAAGGN
jgi:peptidoglycan/LPS O-acetylase OafA/YrhL